MKRERLSYKGRWIGLSQQAFLTSILLVVSSVSLSILAVASLMNAENKKQVLDHLRIDFGLSSKGFTKADIDLVFVKHKRLIRTLEINKYISPAHAVGQPNIDTPRMESFPQTLTHTLVITPIFHDTFDQLFSATDYELSLPASQNQILPLSRNRPRWIIRIGFLGRFESIWRLIAEQGWILFIQSTILTIFALYMMYRALVLPLVNLTEFARRLPHINDIEPPLNKAVSELLILQEALLESHLALKEEQRTLASVYQQLAAHERNVTSSVMSSRVMHEIGNPLSSVMGLIEYVRDQDIDREEQQELLELAYGELQRMKAISRRFLKVSTLHGVETNLGELIDWITLMLTYHEQYSAIKLTVTGETSLSVHVPLEVAQVALLNLVVNAARSQNGQGELWIHISPTQDDDSLGCTPRYDRLLSHHRDHEVRLYLCDQGPDIAAELADDIFEPWMSTAQEGHGLGLAIARSSLEQHNASLFYLIKDQRCSHLIEPELSIHRSKFDGAWFMLSLPILTR
jgi:signal transduction histidine kinase